MYLGQPIFDISKIAMYEYWCDHTKPKNEDKANLFYSYAPPNFIVYAKSGNACAAPCRRC